MFEAKENETHVMGVSDTPPLLPEGWFWEDVTYKCDPFKVHLPSGVIEKGLCMICTKTPQTELKFL
jgi:hypothetical protein